MGYMLQYTAFLRTFSTKDAQRGDTTFEGLCTDLALSIAVVVLASADLAASQDIMTMLRV